MMKPLFYLLLTLLCTELYAFSPAISSVNPDNSTKAPLNNLARPNALPNPITSSMTIYASDISATTWPVTISGGTSSNPVVVTLASDITLTAQSNYFIIGSDYVSFDGNNHTVTISTGGNPYSGLFQNGRSTGPVNGYSNNSIKNIVLSNFNALLSNVGGWIGQDGYGFNATNVIIDNCHSSWPSTIGTNGGGIVGRTSPATVTNCSSEGPIPAGGGGICGKFFSGTVINCHSNGVTSTNSGGIAGSFCIGTAIDCYSTGTISGTGSGGIMGGDAGNDNVGGIIPATATNCYSMGDITGSNSGGIMAQRFNGNVTNCYSTGTIGASAGGIVGNQSPGNVTNCYTIGTEGSGTRGITGTSYTGTVSNCYSSYSGNWSDNEASSILTGTDGTVWTDVDLPSSNVPFRLTSFDAAIYTPSTEDQMSNLVLYSPTGNFSSGTYSIISLDDADPSSGIASINSGDGTLSFNNPTVGSYVAKVLYTDGVNGSYQINSYALNVLAAVVPLTWLSFDVRAKGPSALLNWSTASEQNTHNFEVQHSINVNTWNTIGTVVAKGNTNVTTTYSYSDLNPVNGNNYYRLKQTDIDGKFSYSRIRNLNMVPKRKIFSLLNNPVSNSVLQVNVQAPTTLLLYNSDGRLLWKKQFNAGIKNISLHEVSKGMYFLVGGDVVERVIVR